MFEPIRSLLLAALAIAPLVAFADQGHSHAAKGPNGGQMKDIGAMHVEVVAKPGELVVYLFDAKDAKVPTAGATGKATVLVKGRKTEVALAPDGDNRLSGKGDFAGGQIARRSRKRDARRAEGLAGSVRAAQVTAVRRQSAAPHTGSNAFAGSRRQCEGVGVPLQGAARIRLHRRRRAGWRGRPASRSHSRLRPDCPRCDAARDRRLEALAGVAARLPDAGAVPLRARQCRRPGEGARARRG